MKKDSRLTVENLCIVHKTRNGVTPLVKNLSFEISGNAIMGLAGESGSGKSLSCLAILGLLPPGITQTAGRICLNGKPLSGLSPSDYRKLRGRKIGTVLQNPMSCFDAVFTIRRHFKESLSAHGISWNRETRRQVANALVQVGFDNPDSLMNLYPFQMSGGMLQRVMIALALFMKVSLLIADEPTTDLDLVSQKRVLELIEQLRDAHNMAVLLVTHDLSVMARLADRMMVLHKGRQVDAGNTADIFNAESVSPYTRELLSAHFALYRSAAGEVHTETETMPAAMAV